MRECRQCSKEDAPWFEPAPCSCGLPLDEDDPSPLKHAADCNGIGHEVVLYPVRIDKREMTYDQKLLPKWTAKGWRLMQNGIRYYRVKYLCRQCIVAEDGAQERRREYEKACKATAGGEAISYAQMLASQ